MKKTSLKPHSLGYPIYRAVAQLNRSFEDCIENLNHLMSFDLPDPDSLRTYEVMVEEVRALVNQDFGDFINTAELENATYFEDLRLKWQRQPREVDLASRRQPKRPGRQGQRKAAQE